MTITASMVKELRERTGSGMMECKKALVETGGDIEAAIELMRKSGLAKAGKRAGKVAAEGTIEIAEAADGSRVAMVEVNSETDFVSKGDDFRDFAVAVAKTALEQAPADLDALLAAPLAGGDDTVDAARQSLVAKIGENINVRRFVLFEAGDGALASYLHGTRIGVVVSHTGDATLGKDVAMHVAASRPVCVSRFRGRRSCRPGRQGARDLLRAGRRERQAGQHRREDGRGTAAQVSRRDHARRPAVRQEPGPERR
jgi:elongation factor Ts